MDRRAPPWSPSPADQPARRGAAGVPPARRVTALCCVPTLLATLDEDLPELRFLLVSGEACPQELIARWHRPGRRFLNVYGPTEATVTATWTVVHPDRPVTIGVPLPTYSVVILDPDEDQALPPGEIGEIGIAGIGLARGYVNRDDLTDRAFIPDFLGIAGQPVGPDLPDRRPRPDQRRRRDRVSRPHRHPGEDPRLPDRADRDRIGAAAGARDRPGGGRHLRARARAWWSWSPTTACANDAAGLDRAQIYARAARAAARLHGPGLPRGARRHPDAPERQGRPQEPAAAERPAQPRDAAELRRARPPAPSRSSPTRWPQVMRLERVSVDSHFFDELGANSLLMAQFCARVRQRADLPPVSMQDVYLHPTVAEPGRGPGRSRRRPGSACEPAAPAACDAAGEHARSTCCAALLQACLFFASTYLAALVPGRRPTSGSPPAPTFAGIYLRSARCSALAGFVLLCACPILAKWLLIGRWTAQEIPSGAWRYVRFWLVKALVRSNPLRPVRRLAALHALSAGAGRQDRPRRRSSSPSHVPVCTDLLTIGDGTVIRKDCFFTGYRAQAGRIQIGPVTLGRGRAGRRGDGARHRHRDGRRGPARPRLGAARVPGRARGRALARLPGAADRSGLRAVAPARCGACGAASTPLASCSRCCCSTCRCRHRRPRPCWRPSCPASPSICTPSSPTR